MLIIPVFETLFVIFNRGAFVHAFATIFLVYILLISYKTRWGSIETVLAEMRDILYLMFHR